MMKKNYKLKSYTRERVKNVNEIKELKEYIDIVKADQAGLTEYNACEDQVKLCKYVEERFITEDLYVSWEQINDYLGLQKYFPFKLYPWEKFCFILHCCIYRKNGLLRWPELFVYVGRGSGKNGYLGFEDFALISPYNPIKYYHITISANSEKQAKTSFEDVYNVCDENEDTLKKWFYWNKEFIQCYKTGSVLDYATNNPKTKDGGRQGKTDFDEIHEYQDHKTINVFTSGLGKKKDPRQTYISTNGYVREGPLDDKVKDGEDILNGVTTNDNGMLPFMCRIKNKEQALVEKNWYMANPSLRYDATLLDEIRREFVSYKKDATKIPDFLAKRMNFTTSQDVDIEVTTWDNILSTNQPIPYDELKGCTCIAGIDYMKTTDFLGAGLLFKYKGKYIWITHTWVCTRSKDIPRIKAPLQEWEQIGLLTFIDDVEINPLVPAKWLMQMGQKYNITTLWMDNYRYTLLAAALKQVGFDTDKKGRNNIRLARPSDEMKISPIVTSAFVNHSIVWGDNPLMRWAANNTCMVTSPTGNTTYGKIEPKSRKTDPFKAFIAAMCGSVDLDDCGEKHDIDILDIGVHSY